MIEFSYLGKTYILEEGTYGTHHWSKLTLVGSSTVWSPLNYFDSCHDLFLTKRYLVLIPQENYKYYFDFTDFHFSYVGLIYNDYEFIDLDLVEELKAQRSIYNILEG